MTDTAEALTVTENFRAPSPRVDGYVPLRSYAVIGDGRTVALIAEDGQIDWLPMPEMYTEPVIAGIVDAAKGGRFELRPVDDDFEVDRSYVAGSNVLTTRFRTATGSVEITDALVTGVAGRLPWSELVRRIDGLEGSVELAWAVVPGNTFGTTPIQRIDTVHGPLLRAGDINLILIGSDHGRTDPTDEGDGEVEGPLEFRGAFTTSPGSHHILCLCGTDDEPIHIPNAPVVDQGIDRTIDNWALWSKNFSWDGPWGDAVTRSTLALKLLIYSPDRGDRRRRHHGAAREPRGRQELGLPVRLGARPRLHRDRRCSTSGCARSRTPQCRWILQVVKQNGREMHDLLPARRQPARRGARDALRGVARHRPGLCRQPRPRTSCSSASTATSSRS